MSIRWLFFVLLFPSFALAQPLPTVVAAKASVPSATQACGKTATFTFTVQAPATARYYYRFVRGDGGIDGTVRSAVFPSGTSTLTDTWSLGSTTCSWVGIHFESTPGGDSAVPPSGRVAYFTLNCPGNPQNYTLTPPPDIWSWLRTNTYVANEIKWQTVQSSSTYAGVEDNQKLPYPNWTGAMKTELQDAVSNHYSFLTCGWPNAPTALTPVTDRPPGLYAPPVNPVNATIAQHTVSRDYGWRLYLETIAFSLALETHPNRPPWSIKNYSRESLAALFDSGKMGNINSNEFAMGIYAPYTPTKRLGNRPRTMFASPQWVYDQFLRPNAIIGNTTLATIGNALEWSRDNLSHFFGNDNYANAMAIWEFYGFPTISAVVGGTVDANNPGFGVQHWTAGCHGTVGFLNAVLRAANIPVDSVWVCGHELAYFPSDVLYLDHGDDPYNLNVQQSSAPMTSFLIDQTTYQSWFTSDLTANVLDDASPACANVGRKAAEAGSEPHLYDLLAMGAVATQSSNYDASHPAANAIDKNPSTVAITQSGPTERWELNLGQVRNIDSVTIVSGNGTAYAQTQNTILWIWDTKLNGYRGISGIQYVGAPITISIKAPTNKILIQRNNNTNYQSLGEVQVRGY